ncbi:E3 SUMO-protein ligase ZBED1-like [Brienomyrus brachyistius]|uniref:E3 SUMO-protein ligase ZBED1-like n=1 Tax=Brienomyrus brachyistius TaxID=42636 RepID=UPI0020B22EF8|nr:E3 SUMO-protein ligase ZBED1-like [Brienomyrus brachyistius]
MADSGEYSMAHVDTSENAPEIEIVQAPAAFKSEVWKHFGFAMSTNAKGQRVADKQWTICNHCHATVRYNTGNTSNMRSHLTTHHPYKFTDLLTKKVTSGQKTLQEAFSPVLPHNSVRAQEITRYIAEYIACDLRPFSAVDGKGFKRLVANLEPRYKMPSRAHFSQSVFPALYRKTKEEVMLNLKQSECVAITTDGWTSRATQSYITITAHVLSSEWEMKSYVLQTRLLSESHTGANIAEVLKSAVNEWELDKISTNIAAVTDNASNMRVAVNEAKLSPHIRCFAHTLNLASQAGLKVNAVSRLLGRVRRVASFFHRSSTATAVLTTKQKLLNLPAHKLIIDVVTRWNSSLDMVERYLEQQQAVAAALLSDELRQKSREIDTLDTSDIANAEDLVKLLSPIKKATTVLCDESQPTISLISPLKQMIQESMATDKHDSNVIAQMKAAILKDLSDRYQGEDEKFLQESSALDPRFRTLQHLGSKEREDVFERIKLKASQMQQQNQDQDVLSQSSHSPDPANSNESFVPPPKKHALEDLLGSSFGCNDSEVTGGIQGKVQWALSIFLRGEEISGCPSKSLPYPLYYLWVKPPL